MGLRGMTIGAKATVIGTCDFCGKGLEIVPYDQDHLIIRCEYCHMTYGKESLVPLPKPGEIEEEINESQIK